MVKLTLLFRQPPETQPFELRYVANLALLEKMPGIQRRQACLVIGGPGGASPYYRILEFYFQDQAALDSALRSPEGVAAGGDLMHFAASFVELIFAEVFED